MTARYLTATRRAGARPPARPAATIHAVVLAACASLVLTLATACDLLPGGQPDKPAPTPSPDLTRSPTPVATWAGPYHSGPVKPPAHGAYLGAWVRPAQLTQPGRLAAVDRWEAVLDRRLRIVNTYRRFDEMFGTASDRDFLRQGKTMMVSWASGDTRSITAGHHDDLIRQQARRIRDAGKPILLRFRWEMDRPNLRATMWSAEDYIAAWRYVRRVFDDERVRNASWVWCPTAEGFMRGDAPAFYPGDDVVDWTCVDVYAGSAFRSLGDLLEPFFTWARGHHKPIIIGEFGVARAWGSAQRAAWLRDAARTIKANRQVKAVSYFESDPDGNTVHGQFRLSDDAPAFRAFIELSRDPYFNPPPPR